MVRNLHSQWTYVVAMLAVHAAIALDSEVSQAESCQTNGSAFVQISPPSIRRLPLERDEQSLSQVDASATVTIVSYNLFWWNVRQNNRWASLFQRIRDARSFDLIGFQECDDVAEVLRSTGLDSFDYYQGPTPNPAPIAWNRDVFQRIAGPNNKYIATDRWGKRHLTWVRLRHRNGATVFFANAHGPLDNCGTTVGNNWLGGVNENRVSSDTVLFTGDFNCATGTPAMNILKGQLTVAFDGGIDQILSDKGAKVVGGSGKRDGSPSDHPLIKGVFTVTGSGGSSTPRRRRAANPRRRRSAGRLTGASQCSEFSQWPNIKDGVKCNRCTALVLTDPYQGRCDRYCQSFGHTCVGAAEEQSNNCDVKYSASCSQPISGTSDMLCACQSSSAGQSQSSTSCSDSNGQCSAWASRGECSRNPQYMLASCKKSCNACSGTSAQCNDGNSQCAAWAINGECGLNPAYMNVNCKRSCSRC